LTGLLIEVVKTQQEKIEILESRLDKLENWHTLLFRKSK
jgi:hypothetical protein